MVQLSYRGAILSRLSRSRFRDNSPRTDFGWDPVQIHMNEYASKQLSLIIQLFTYTGNVYSPPTRACLWILRSYKIPHRFEVIDLWGGGTDTEEFKTLNPARTVPVLVENDYTLSTGSSIMKYLCERFSEIPTHLYPDHDLEKRAKIDQWMFWQHLNIRSASGALMHSSVSKDIAEAPSMNGSADVKSKKIVASRSLKPSISFKDRNLFTKFEKSVYNEGDVVESRGGRLVRGDVISLERALGVLNSVLADNRPFITGDEVTVADLRISFELVQLEAERHLKYVRFGEVKTNVSVEKRLPEYVEKWMGRMSSLPKFVDSYDGMLDLHLKLFEAQHNFYVSKSNVGLQNAAM